MGDGISKIIDLLGYMYWFELSNVCVYHYLPLGVIGNAQMCVESSVLQRANGKSHRPQVENHCPRWPQFCQSIYSITCWIWTRKTWVRFLTQPQTSCGHLIYPIPQVLICKMEIVPSCHAVAL